MEGHYYVTPNEALRIAHYHFYAVPANNAFSLHVSKAGLYLSREMLQSERTVLFQTVKVIKKKKQEYREAPPNRRLKRQDN